MPSPKKKKDFKSVASRQAEGTRSRAMGRASSKTGQAARQARGGKALSGTNSVQNFSKPQAARTQREMRDLRKAQDYTAKAKGAGRSAARSAGTRSAQGAARALGRAAGLAGAVAAGVDAVRSVVEPRANAAKAARSSYNQRAGTSHRKAQSEVRRRTPGRKKKK